MLYPGLTLMDNLPAIYRKEEDRPDDFLRTLVGVLETTTQDIDQRIGAMGRQNRAKHCPKRLAGFRGALAGRALGRRTRARSEATADGARRGDAEDARYARRPRAAPGMPDPGRTATFPDNRCHSRFRLRDPRGRRL